MPRRYLCGYLLLLCQLCVYQTSARARPTEPANPQVYRNQASGFCYTILYGWVDRTNEMGEGPEGADGGKPHSRVLLAVFERPPQAQSSELNSAVIIASEPVAAYQGLKTAADYFGPLAEVTSAHGLNMQGEPYDVVISNRHLARGDFSKKVAKTTIYQSTLVLLDKGSVLSFTFIAENPERVSNLIENLQFGACRKS